MLMCKYRNWQGRYLLMQVNQQLMEYNFLSWRERHLRWLEQYL
jgi:hypothetical protein